MQISHQAQGRMTTRMLSYFNPITRFFEMSIVSSRDRLLSFGYLKDPLRMPRKMLMQVVAFLSDIIIMPSLYQVFTRSARRDLRESLAR
jgi:hypothetical protein